MLSTRLPEAVVRFKTPLSSSGTAKSSAYSIFNRKILKDRKWTNKNTRPETPLIVRVKALNRAKERVGKTYRTNGGSIAAEK